MFTARPGLPVTRPRERFLPFHPDLDMQSLLASGADRILMYSRSNALSSIGLITVLLVHGGTAFSQTSENEPAAVLELGAAAGQSLKGGGFNSGPAIAMEVTPIDTWLELEGGVTAFASHGRTEWDTDLIFKKPWTLSGKVEFMFGIGPEWVHTTSHGMTTNSVGGAVVLDFMCWPGSNHGFGWYLEPSYGYDFGRGHEQSLGVSAGLLIAIPNRRR
jgi:hypothetical protein